MAKVSAGLLLYRWRAGRLEVLLVHPGGPYWAHREAGAWSIPKGEVDPGEDLLAAARREFREETGQAPPAGAPLALTPRRQPSGKRVHAFALEGAFAPERLSSNTFTMEWPPGSGRRAAFPEVDRAAWFDLATARAKIVPGQRPFLDELAARLAEAGPPIRPLGRRGEPPDGRG